jgi:transposase
MNRPNAPVTRWPVTDVDGCVSRSPGCGRYVSDGACGCANPASTATADRAPRRAVSDTKLESTDVIPPETEAEILRLALAEKWRVGTIARQLGRHHSTVARVLRDRGATEPAAKPRKSMSDPFVPLIVETLEKYPKLPASSLFHMVRERGYPGTSEGHFRRIVAKYRPRRAAEAFLRLRTLPGEQAQVDWGHFGHEIVGECRRPLMAFVMVLSWSRRIFLRFYLNQRMGSFLEGHVAAFHAFGGVPRVALYDNLKSAVLERRGDAIRFHPTLLELAGHYCYEPRPVAPARGNEKGRVERAIRYVRTSFIPARTWRDVDDLNQQAEQWCLGLASDRPCPEERQLTVAAAFKQERPHLLALPGDDFPAHEQLPVQCGKTPYVRFDRNDYSVPHTHVRRTLSVVADSARVRVLDAGLVIADHPRCWDRGRQVEEESHVAALVARKRQAAEHRGLDRLTHAVPEAQKLLVAAAHQGRGLGGITAHLLRLLDQYGAAELREAVLEAVERDVPHPHAVRQSLQRRRQERDLPPALAIPLPERARELNPVVTPHPLSDYDRLEDTHDDV